MTRSIMAEPSPLVAAVQLVADAGSVTVDHGGILRYLPNEIILVTARFLGSFDSLEAYMDSR